MFNIFKRLKQQKREHKAAMNEWEKMLNAQKAQLDALALQMNNLNSYKPISYPGPLQTQMQSTGNWLTSTTTTSPTFSWNTTGSQPLWFSDPSPKLTPAQQQKLDAVFKDTNPDPDPRAEKLKSVFEGTNPDHVL